MKKMKFPNIEFFIGLPFFFIFIYFLSLNNKFNDPIVGNKYTGRITEEDNGNGRVRICYDDTTCFAINDIYNEDYHKDYRSLADNITVGDSFSFHPGINDTFYLYKKYRIYKYLSFEFSNL